MVLGVHKGGVGGGQRFPLPANKRVDVIFLSLNWFVVALFGVTKRGGVGNSNPSSLSPVFFLVLCTLQWKAVKDIGKARLV